MYLVVIYSSIYEYAETTIYHDFDSAKEVAQERFVNGYFYNEEIYICELPLRNNNNVNLNDLL